ncbi:Hypothetical protein A7982_03270 [Minicystis rosea]|nr:Hypothetical protein A7982_03270 [Minicystis rosea]
MLRLSRPILAIALLTMVSACSKDGGSSADDPAHCATSKNDEVRLTLAKTCSGCHGEGSNKPFFASLESFEASLVYEPKFVVAGKPDQSYLVKLLEGTSTSVFKQMPPQGDTFAALDKKGSTSISMDDIRDWIKDLPEPGPELSKPLADAPTTRRLTAEEIARALVDQLGLEQADFVRQDYYLFWDNAVPVYSPDGINPPYDHGTTPSHGWPTDRFLALGGPYSLHYQSRDNSITPGMVQALVVISQAWCGMSFNKMPAPLLKYATLTDTTTESADNIKKNIGYMQTRMLGEADSAETKALYDVFKIYEPQGANIAWTAVCATLVRHPQWMMF